jgi:hemolysin activation/secretion protein
MRVGSDRTRRCWIQAALALAVLAGGHTSRAADEQDFAVLEYRVLGNSVLPVRTIEQAVMGHLGPGKTIKDVEAARTDLESAYHRAGYGTVYVDIPEQSVAEGVVRLRATEGRLRSAAVTGARYFSQRQIKAAVPEAREGAVPQLSQLQQQIAQVNARSPDRSVVPVLKAGPVPGTVDLSMRVDDKRPFHGSIEVNNQYTADTTPNRLLATLSYGNMFGRLDTFSAQYESSPARRGQVEVLAANYAANIGTSGSQLAVYVLHSNSDIAALGTLAVLGKGTVYGLRWVDPLVSEARLLQSVTLGVDYKNYGQSVNVNPGTSLNTPIHYTSLFAAYNESRTLGVAALQWSVNANFGPRGIPNDELEFANKRFAASANYFYVRTDGSLVLTSKNKWQLSLTLDGQFAAEPLISNEEFSIGGAASVRGYLETEALGDTGGRASVQLQPPPWHLTRGTQVTAFVFLDAARVRTLDALASDVPSTSLRSVGTGFNFTALQCMSGNLTWADSLLSAGRTQAHDSRLLFDARCAW